MAYNIIVPFQDASPGIFPAQNNENFQRLRDIINNDHYFSNSVDVAQGIHKQCTMINRADPGSLPAGSGILYSKNDTNGNAQLNWYNGSSIVQMTPGVQLIEGTTTVNAGVTTAIFNDPGYSYQATCWMNIVGLTNQGYAIAFLTQPGGATSRAVTTLQSTAVTVSFTYNSTNNLSIFNDSLTNRTCKWALQISRLS